ncbi:MAG: T9SS type A sorting domain-containing protein [Bacteroidetes bacterium]|nr:T9SS type A sorting domain-containing protein [Bacteroidota bacterium]
MKRNLTLILAFFTLSLQAQTVTWKNVLRGENQFNPSMNSSAITADNNGYWASHLSKFRLSYGQVYLGNQDIVHLDFHGEMDDTIKVFGNANVKMLHQYNDRLYMWIGFFDSVRLDTIHYNRPNNYSTFLCYRDANGIKSLGLLGDTVSIVNILPDGNIIQASTGGFGGNCTLESYAPDGSNKKSKILKSLGYAQAITPAKDGGIFITGGCMGSNIQIDSIQENNTFSYTNYVLYLDAKWEGKWMKYIEDVTCLPSAAGGTSNSAYWTGTTHIKPVFGGLTYTGGPSTSFTDFFTAKISNKQYNWVREIPEDTTIARINFGETHSTGVDEKGNFYALGSVSGNPIHWNSQLVTGRYKNNGNIILASWDPSGKIRWIKDIGGTGYEMGLELHVKGEDNLFFSAVVTDTFDIDGDTVNADYGDILVVKMGEENNTSTNKIAQKTVIKYYPNPGNGTVLHNAKVVTEYYITDIAGRKVQTGKMKPGVALDLISLPNGMYFISTENNTTIYLKSKE